MTFNKRQVIGIFGGTGRIGHHLIPALLKQGWEVRAWSRQKNIQINLH